MIVSEEVDYKLLAILADGKSHSWFEVVYLGVQYLKVPQDFFEKLLHRAVIDNNWIYRTGEGPDLKSDHLKLTTKGDEYYRYLVIRHLKGDTSYYKYFNRSQASSGVGSHGLDHYAPLPTRYQPLDGS